MECFDEWFSLYFLIAFLFIISINLIGNIKGLRYMYWDMIYYIMPERVQAGIYLLFYPLLASLPLLIALLNFYQMNGTLYLYGFLGDEVSNLKCLYLWFIYDYLRLMLKLLFLLMLAGVLLKLGGYGLMRVFGIIVDLKSLIAYSSVVHIEIVLGGLMTLNSWGFCGCYLIIIGYGLCSSGLFWLSNTIYERLGSRRLIINKGLI
ncbi:NADH-ubiquinone oxidoreductase chain 4, partial [Gryllus bimaculatus]